MHVLLYYVEFHHLIFKVTLKLEEAVIVISRRNSLKKPASAWFWGLHIHSWIDSVLNWFSYDRSLTLEASGSWQILLICSAAHWPPRYLHDKSYWHYWHSATYDKVVKCNLTGWMFPGELHNYVWQMRYLTSTHCSAIQWLPRYLNDKSWQCY